MQPKIALCFLTYGNLSKPELWTKFINPKYNIYIHNKYDFDGEFNKFIIKNKIETSWGKISIVRAMLLLLREACNDSNNEYFVFLSGDSIPLYDIDRTYDKVFSLNNNALCVNNKNYERISTLAKKEFFTKSQFMKNSQWFILNKIGAKFFINNNMTDVFGNKSLFPEEHYFVSMFNKYNIQYINKQTLYTDWSDSKRESNGLHPKTFNLITDTMLDKILLSDAIFMRKIAPDCILPEKLLNL